MTKTTSLLAAMALATGLAAGPAATPAAAADSGNFTDTVEYSWSEIKQFSAEKSETAKRRSQELVNEMDAAIERLEARSERLADDAQAKASESWQETLEKLRDMRRVAAKQADAMGDASAGAWDETKEGFHNAANAFADAYEDAKDELSTVEETSSDDGS
jgi:flagellar motility protein MotE (MotC chaperone)